MKIDWTRVPESTIKLEKAYKSCFDFAYRFNRDDPAEWREYIKRIENKTNPAYRGYIAGAKQAELERFEKNLDEIVSKQKQMKP